MNKLLIALTLVLSTTAVNAASFDVMLKSDQVMAVGDRYAKDYPECGIHTEGGIYREIYSYSNDDREVAIKGAQCSEMAVYVAYADDGGIDFMGLHTEAAVEAGLSKLFDYEGSYVEDYKLDCSSGTCTSRSSELDYEDNTPPPPPVNVKEESRFPDIKLNLERHSRFRVAGDRDYTSFTILKITNVGDIKFKASDLKLTMNRGSCGYKQITTKYFSDDTPHGTIYEFPKDEVVFGRYVYFAIDRSCNILEANVAYHGASRTFTWDR